MGIGSSITAAGGIIPGAILTSRENRRNRKRAYGREDTQIQRTVADAKAAGVHPLFALGGATGGSAYQAPPTGSGIGRAFQKIGRGQRGPTLVDNALIKQAIAAAGLSNAREDTVRWQLENSIIKRAESQSNIVQDTVIPALEAGAQEIKLGQVDPYKKKAREQSRNIKSPMTQVRIGSQNVWVPVEEIDEFMENPLAVGALTYAYHGNKNIDWVLLMKEYSGKRTLSQYMKDNIKKHIPIRVRKKHLLKKYAKPANYGAMP